MTPDPDQPYIPAEPPRHVESVTPLSERVTWKAEQEKKRRKKRRPKQHIDEQLEEEMANEQDTGSNGHIDFHA
jgi:hypothetical protein